MMFRVCADTMQNRMSHRIIDCVEIGTNVTRFGVFCVRIFLFYDGVSQTQVDLQCLDSRELTRRHNEATTLTAPEVMHKMKLLR